MIKKYVYLFLFLLTYILSTNAQEYQISGTVKKKNGGPLKGVNVSLKVKKISTVTGEDGTFKLIPSAAIQMRVPNTNTLSFYIQGNKIMLPRAEGKFSGNVSIFCENGRKIANLDFRELNPVKDYILLPQLPVGLNVIRLTVNNNSYKCLVMRIGNDIYLINRNSKNTEDFYLSRSAAAAIDTIVATKDGYKESVIPIESYILNDLVIEMDSIGEPSGEIAWGKVENPTAHCKVGTLPEYNELKSNLKLPDPFMKLDGTRIKNKSEWACQRELLRQMLLKYIYGDKPVPAKGSVSGTVTTTNISVKVTEGGKSCSFTATVNMNGATQPAPAMILYGEMGGAPVPSGVAKIVFNPIETQGGSGDKKGPFYDLYGSKHPAGYLTAQAWQVSRILDVIEQNPGIIDPYRIGVTGCSRWGKGAFVAGVLDNRIALTIPVESGMGGTVGLRLKEQLDPGDNSTAEWPYHAISYVRWLSEVALGKFTSANNASGDNTDRLPVDMHSAMALIVPRAIYVVDNPGITNLDPKSAYVTASAGKAIFEALGVGDHFSSVGASGSHCIWRNQYSSPLDAMINKFLKGNNSVQTGTFTTDLSNKPNPKQYYDWDATVIPGDL